MPPFPLFPCGQLSFEPFRASILFMHRGHGYPHLIHNGEKLSPKSRKGGICLFHAKPKRLFHIFPVKPKGRFSSLPHPFIVKRYAPKVNGIEYTKRDIEYAIQCTFFNYIISNFIFKIKILISK